MPSSVPDVYSVCLNPLVLQAAADLAAARTGTEHALAEAAAAREETRRVQAEVAAAQQAAARVSAGRRIH